MIEQARFWAAAAMLAGAAAMDLRTRGVSNAYWPAFLAIAAVLWAADDSRNWRSLAGAFFSMTAAFLVWGWGGYGGADAKALMVLAWLAPGAPAVHAGRITPAVDALTTAGILSAAWIIIALALGSLPRRGIPFLVAVFAGFLVSWFMGNPLLHLFL